MDKGSKMLLCMITLILIVIAEKGIPVKFEALDIICYLIVFIVLLVLSEYFITKK
jgi:hypothetical protein